MNLQPVIDLLRDGPWKRVEGLDALALLSTEPTLALPLAYVVLDSETALPPAEGSRTLDQVIQSTISIVLVTRPDGARRGVAASQLDELEEEALVRLFGKQLPGWDSPFTILDISMLGISADMISRVLRLRARRRRRVDVAGL